ncbi:glycosyltransferase family 2 protein [Paenibacillus albicereus]|uniref:Glycosyltransferase family 2 protein n=1 Tax=Paenibacillus albicereus TaxID=2726185 RepID=A0A6H2H1M8_9BACL|nr:glycosyltransferase family 2 protein [Paenibacillus albicereus]QJC53594.1 glycosyltransferase family 2 protein [Paenibacillus albicereus]
MDSSAYIADSLERIAQELAALSPRYRPVLIVGLNGTDDGGASRQAIREFYARHDEVDGEWLELPEAGKNAALNAIADRARSLGCAILHFLDDDIRLDKGSLELNLDALVREERRLGIPVLVGSNFVAEAKPLRQLREERGSWPKALWSGCLQQLFLLPFLPHTDKPEFCLGGSLGAFLRTFPRYPDDATGIADDGFIGNHYALLGKERYEADGTSSIVKPAGSVFRFHVATGYREWIKQQVRIFVGVYYSYLLHEEELPYFRKRFAWEYSIGKDFRRPPARRPGLREALRRGALRLLQRRVWARSMRWIDARGVPAWAPAGSSKPPAAGRRPGGQAQEAASMNAGGR